MIRRRNLVCFSTLLDRLMLKNTTNPWRVLATNPEWFRCGGHIRWDKFWNPCDDDDVTWKPSIFPKDLRTKPGDRWLKVTFTYWVKLCNFWKIQWSQFKTKIFNFRKAKTPQLSDHLSRHLFWYFSFVLNFLPRKAIDQKVELSNEWVCVGWLSLARQILKSPVNYQNPILLIRIQPVFEYMKKK